MELYVRDEVGRVPKAQYRVNIPDFNQYDHYQQFKSMTAFYTFWVNQPRSDERQLLVKRSTDAGLFPFFDNALPVIACSTLWEFYDRINWCHKRKRFLKGETP